MIYMMPVKSRYGFWMRRSAQTALLRGRTSHDTTTPESGESLARMARTGQVERRASELLAMGLDTERADRQAHRDAIATLFKAAPLKEIEPETLKAITPHYQQRISECRRDLGMIIRNVPRSLTDAGGRKRKRDGAYRFEPFERLGRDAGTIVAAGWSGKHQAPFQEVFRLKP